MHEIKLNTKQWLAPNMSPYATGAGGAAAGSSSKPLLQDNRDKSSSGGEGGGPRLREFHAEGADDCDADRCPSARGSPDAEYAERRVLRHGVGKGRNDRAGVAGRWLPSALASARPLAARDPYS